MTTEKKPTEHKLTRTQIFTARMLSAYKIENKTSSDIITPFSDFPCKILTIGFDAAIKSINGKVKKNWLPLRLLSSNDFYSIKLSSGQKAVMIHGKLKKSAGFISSDIKSNQASYTYTYSHHTDPHEKAEGKAPINEQEIEECAS